MNENLDLTKILKDCPKGTKLYSPLLGEVDFQKIRNDDECAIVVMKGIVEDSFTKEGFYYANLGDECILFPSREQRDWNKFTAPWYKKEKFDPKTLKPFDRVLVKNGAFPWRCDIFSYYRKNKRKTCYCVSDNYIYDKCIPYNEETNHLVGTCEDAPELYRYWED